MLSTRGQQGLALAVVSLASLGVVYVICLWCRKRKRKIKQEENQLYDPREPPVIQREGSRFAVTRSKTVTKHNQISRRPPPEEPIDAAAITPEGQASYQNIKEFGTCEPTYVDPIPTNLYGNDPEEDQCSYENVFPTSSIKHQSDGSDYENADFLVHNKITDDELDEPDYVNQGET
ncbi:LAT2 domain-containing protein [Sardina pilchardus]|uniref:LAT2 domain-containing protein n=1 Tax=Sardina pilchardus TaxID=27697 RepID=UPI002E11C099